MAYVLEYTGPFYQRRQRRFTTRIAAFAVLLVVGIFFMNWYRQESRKPTFEELVRNDYQPLADKAFMLQDSWNQLKTTHNELAPYLQLVWAPAPVTNLVGALAEVLVDDARRLPLLEPESFSIQTDSSAPAQWLQEGAATTNLAYAKNLLVSVQWRTIRKYRYADEIRDGLLTSLSNLFQNASSPAVSRAAADLEVREVVFPDKGEEGAIVEVKYAFPTLLRLPTSPSLDAIVEHLKGFHEYAVSENWTGKSGGSIKETFADYMGNESFQRSMDPGAWICGKSPFNKDKPVMEVWRKGTTRRSPWERGVEKRLHNRSGHWIPLDMFQTALANLPDKAGVENVRKTLWAKCGGFTNALETVKLLDVDADPYSMERFVATTNLLEAAGVEYLYPTNQDWSLKQDASLVVYHPAKDYEGGFLLPLETCTNRYEFARWSYACPAEADEDEGLGDSFSQEKTRKLALKDLARGLSEFVGKGTGFEVESLSVVLEGRLAVEVEARGILPMMLNNEERP